MFCYGSDKPVQAHNSALNPKLLFTSDLSHLRSGTCTVTWTRSEELCSDFPALKEAGKTARLNCCCHLQRIITRCVSPASSCLWFHVNMFVLHSGSCHHHKAWWRPVSCCEHALAASVVKCVCASRSHVVGLLWQVGFFPPTVTHVLYGKQVWTGLPLQLRPYFKKLLK